LLSSRFKLDKRKFKLVINKKKAFSCLITWEISRIIDFPIESFICFDRRFNKSNFLTNNKKVSKTKLFKQVKKIIKIIFPELEDAKR